MAETNTTMPTWQEFLAMLKSIDLRLDFYAAETIGLSRAALAVKNLQKFVIERSAQ